LIALIACEYPGKGTLLPLIPPHKMTGPGRNKVFISAAVTGNNCYAQQSHEEQRLQTVCLIVAIDPALFNLTQAA
jgi:hypothetical protein